MNCLGTLTIPLVLQDTQVGHLDSSHLALPWLGVSLMDMHARKDYHNRRNTMHRCLEDAEELGAVPV